ncbi:hypothetical protein JB92DRAFT_2735731 [Gautieria morchelliformis]|nr:hypothetical protein JB92DRAFT_2735731 [Gautieria morchelliformis]
MGGSSSKVGRTLPTKARASGQESQGTRPALPPTRPPPVASETKDQDVERDGKDPHLLANLSRIGQVNIHSTAATARTVSIPFSEMYRKRHVAEQQAASGRPVRNHLEASTLSTLLDDRKFVTSRSDLKQLAARYTVDVSVLDRLARFVNSPSIGDGTVVRRVDKDGQERITMQVCLHLKWSSSVV